MHRFAICLSSLIVSAPGVSTLGALFFVTILWKYAESLVNLSYKTIKYG